MKSIVTQAPGGLVGLLATLALASCGALAASASTAAFRQMTLPQHHEAGVHQRHTQPAPHPKPRPTAPFLTLAPAHGSLPGWLHTAGTTIVDAHDRPVRLAAVNWSGADLTDFVPGGLAYRPYMDILRTIKYLGFNAIRLPFSNELVERNPVVHLHIAANPQFRGKHALQILDAIINGARQVGLMIILDNHLAAASGPGPGVVQESALWYLPPHYTQQRWLADWLMLARRYRDNPAVVGVDLHNEPHSDGPGLEILGLGYLHHGATWGPFEGRDNPATDWRLAAEQAGNAILHVNPHLLIIVEGVEVYPYRNPLPGPFCPNHIPATGRYCADLYWWGGNLAGAKDYPVVLDEPHHLVYSTHEYGPQMHGQRWFTPHMSQAAWQQQMYKHWGYLLDARGPNAAPVFVGEFGTSANDHAMRSMSGTLQGRWFWALIDYLHHHPNVGWAYWAVNGTRSEQPDGVRSRLDKGLLATDWARVASPTLLEALHTIQ